MYLKRVSMQGFKSFANPVTMEFDRGMTCIVGPNGSGKSNVSDAMRWVLGEQSAKVLRGMKMEEVIFAGSDKTRSKGMAEVTIVIDNEDGRLPVDFSEVAITRRLYKSGESEYLINGASCRLKDIREIITDTGLGVDGYSIIGQGKIAEIVSGRPDERRLIFEEAAGISKYRFKKTEAERKLAVSEQNLDRIRDIFIEVGSRREKLSKDSEKAGKYVALREQYREAEINVLLSEIEELDLKNEYVLDDINEAQYNMNEQEKKKKAIDRELAELRRNAADMELREQNLRDEYMKFSEGIADKKNTAAVSRERLASLEDRRRAYSDDLFSFREKVEREKGELRKLSDDDSGIEEKLVEIEAKMNEREREFNRRVEELESDFDYEGEKAALASLEEEFSNMADALGLVKNEISVTGARVEVLKDLEDSHEGYNYAVKFIMKQKLPGIYGAVGELIDVPEGYETAVNVALGGQLQNIVCENDASARDGINALKRSSAGRLTFLPAASIRTYNDGGKGAAEALKMPGVRGIAADIVKTDPKFNVILDYLLGRVIVVDNLDNAAKVSKTVRGGYRFVTLEGELINNAGAITGGSSKVNKTGGIFERKTEITRLESYMSALYQRQKEMTLKRDEVQSKINASRKNMQEYEQNCLEKKRQLMSEKESRITELRLEAGGVTAERNNLIRLRQRIESGIRELEKDILGRESSIAFIDNETLRFRNAADEAEKQQAELEKQMNSAGIELDVLKDQRKAGAEKLLAGEAEKGELDKVFYHYKTQKYELEMKAEQNRIQIDALKNKIWEEFEISYAQAMDEADPDFDGKAGQKLAKKLKSQIRELGDVNLSAIEEYREVKERYDFLEEQQRDLEESIGSLKDIIKDLDSKIKNSFVVTFNEINEHFAAVFADLFEGGMAGLTLMDPENPLESGIDISAQPPGKKLRNLNLMSGGEKTMTAIALMLAVLKTRPTPFCIMDEVEAALDEMNAERFSDYISGFSEIQFILITHQKATMQHAHVLYGVTMAEKGISKVLSLRLDGKDKEE